MSKYNDLWIYVDLIFKQTGKEKLELSFSQIKDAAGIELVEITVQNNEAIA